MARRSRPGNPGNSRSAIFPECILACTGNKYRKLALYEKQNLVKVAWHECLFSKLLMANVAKVILKTAFYTEKIQVPMEIVTSLWAG